MSLVFYLCVLKIVFVGIVDCSLLLVRGRKVIWYDICSDTVTVINAQFFLGLWQLDNKQVKIFTNNIY